MTSLTKDQVRAAEAAGEDWAFQELKACAVDAPWHLAAEDYAGPVPAELHVRHAHTEDDAARVREAQGLWKQWVVRFATRYWNRERR